MRSHTFVPTVVSVVILLAQSTTSRGIAAIPNLDNFPATNYAVVTPPLDTPWTYNATATERWPDYPRPQLQRSEWLSLNGIWKWQYGKRDEKLIPSRDTFQREVLVPSCLESGLSGLKVGDAPDSWYLTSFVVPSNWSDQRVLLNFGAVDYATSVYINGSFAGFHAGGYTSFSMDITDEVSFGRASEIHVRVHDPTDTVGSIPVGKQTLSPSHIFYTSCTGIWQSVWIEAAPAQHIEQLDLHGSTLGTVTVTAHASVGDAGNVSVAVFRHGKFMGSAVGSPNEKFVFDIGDPEIWSPSNPSLYDVEVTYGNDTVQSYMGFRTVGKGSVKGVKRPLLNGQFLFQMGVLDQGYWPDGIYTAPSQGAMRFDLEMIKKAGFNMVRKHVKVEPSLFYRACDELGILVVQDMPSMPVPHPSDAETEEFGVQLETMVKQHLSHPSIYAWTIYNEAWGQGDAVEDAPDWVWAGRVKKIDRTRLIDASSGWHDHGAGDYASVHHYPDPQCGIKEVSGPSKAYDYERVAFQSEFGGLGTRPAPENLWNEITAMSTINETYAVYADMEEWNQKSHDMLEILRHQVSEKACSAAVWTQLTDVEGEVNGLMSYDRRIVRMDMAQWRTDIRGLHAAAEKWQGEVFNAFAKPGVDAEALMTP